MFNYLLKSLENRKHKNVITAILPNQQSTVSSFEATWNTEHSARAHEEAQAKSTY